MSGTKRARPEEDSDGLRGRILEIAIQLFATKGFAATSMREVVAEAGCTKPALYYYFESKAGLFRSAVGLAHQRLDSADQTGAEGGSVRDQLRRSLESLAEHIAAKPNDLRLLFRAQSHADLDPELIDTRPIRDAHVAIIEELLRAGIESGEIRPDVPIEDAAISLVGMLHLQFQMWLDGRDLADDFADRILSIYMNGVAR
jgi:AcrR family transcriptional regulator